MFFPFNKMVKKKNNKKYGIVMYQLTLKITRIFWAIMLFTCGCLFSDRCVCVDDDVDEADTMLFRVIIDIFYCCVYFCF